MRTDATQLAGQALSNLVSQFRSALDCLRELVQNAIDAGTPQVDVWLDFVAPPAGQPTADGVITLHVDDYGAGMDEAIIDQQLTRLFASTKEDDLTTIGKFGIGFVSIFALEPRGVLLHTGRGGQYWEVFFDADRTFTKAALETPVEGTQITLFLSGDEARYLHLVDGARRALKRWCRHADVEITFEDRAGLSRPRAGTSTEVINEPFTLPGLVAAAVEAEGTRMVLAYDLRPTFAFFNRGLTLAELADPDEVPSRFKNVAFKITSRYLEHTLSRETILRDANYTKAIRLLEAAADGPLHKALLAALEALVAQPRWTLAEEGRYQQLLAYLAREPESAIAAAEDRPILRGVDRQPVTLGQVVASARRHGRIFATHAPHAITEDLAAEGTPVLFSRARVGSAQSTPPQNSPGEGEGARADDASELANPWPHGACAALRVAVEHVANRERARPLRVLQSLITRRDYIARAASMVARPEDVYIAVHIDEALPEDEGQLISRAERLLGDLGVGYRRIVGCALLAPAHDPPLFVVGRRVGGRMATPPLWASAGTVDTDWASHEAAVNREHLHFRALCRLHRRAPGLAAYGLAKSLLLHDDQLLSRDLELLGRALGDPATPSVSPAEDEPSARRSP